MRFKRRQLAPEAPGIVNAPALVCFRGNVQTSQTSVRKSSPIRQPLETNGRPRSSKLFPEPATLSTLDVTTSPGRVCSSKEQRKKAGFDQLTSHNPGTPGTCFSGAPDTIRTCDLCFEKRTKRRTNSGPGAQLAPAMICIVTPTSHPQPTTSVRKPRGSACAGVAR